MDPRLQLMQAQMIIEQKKKQLAEKVKKGPVANKAKNAIPVNKDNADKKVVEKSKVTKIEHVDNSKAPPIVANPNEAKEVVAKTENCSEIKLSVKEITKQSPKGVINPIANSDKAISKNEIISTKEAVRDRVFSKFNEESDKLIKEVIEYNKAIEKDIINPINNIKESIKPIIEPEKTTPTNNSKIKEEPILKSVEIQSVTEEQYNIHADISKDIDYQKNDIPSVYEEIVSVPNYNIREEQVTGNEVFEIKMDLQAQMKKLQLKKFEKEDRKREEALKIKKQLLKQLMSQECTKDNDIELGFMTFNNKEQVENIYSVEEEYKKEDEVIEKEEALPFAETVNEIALQIEPTEKLPDVIEDNLFDTAHFLIHDLAESNKEDTTTKKNTMTFGKQSETSKLIQEQPHEIKEGNKNFYVMDFGEANSSEKNKHFEAVKRRQAKREEERLNQCAQARNNTPPNGQPISIGKYSKPVVKRGPSNDLYLYPQIRLNTPKEEKELSPKPESAKPTKLPKESKGKRTPIFSKPCNHQLIKNAIANVCLAGEPNKKRRTEALEALATIDNAKNAVVLFKDVAGMRQDFKALYSYSEEEGILRLVYGAKDSPVVIDQSMVNDFYRYDSGAKEFRHIPGNKSFSIAVDAVSLRPLLVKKKSNLDKII